MKPLALDLYCCGGGATKGLQDAGFFVIGVDVSKQPRYCGDLFVQADALNPPFDLRIFDFIWASPPCQAHTYANNRDAKGKHVDLIPATRQMLRESGVVWCMENVPGAPLRADLVLDGTMFPGLRVIRRRHFELSFPAPFLLGFPSQNLVANGWSSVTDGDNSSHVRAARRKRGLPHRDSNQKRADDMGIAWHTNRHDLGEAIPPAYSEFIGRAALNHIHSRAPHARPCEQAPVTSQAAAGCGSPATAGTNSEPSRCVCTATADRLPVTKLAAGVV